MVGKLYFPSHCKFLPVGTCMVGDFATSYHRKYPTPTIGKQIPNVGFESVSFDIRWKLIYIVDKTMIAVLICCNSQNLLIVKDWIKGLNSNLPNSLLVTQIIKVDDDFHSRFSALARSYTYCIYNSNQKPIFFADYVQSSNKCRFWMTGIGSRVGN